MPGDLLIRELSNIAQRGPVDVGERAPGEECPEVAITRHRVNGGPWRWWDACEAFAPVPTWSIPIAHPMEPTTVARAAVTLDAHALTEAVSEPTAPIGMVTDGTGIARSGPGEGAVAHDATRAVTAARCSSSRSISAIH